MGAKLNIGRFFMQMHYIPFKFYPRNRLGRDFVVGDLHGMYSALDDLLGKIAFDREKDRLFSVGDLVDRGNESHRAVDYLQEDWFFAIKGNHEIMLLDAVNDDIAMNNWVKHNGGDWWPDAEEEVQTTSRKLLDKLPIACEIQTEHANFGLVHANVPYGITWQGFVKALKHNKDMRDYALWSRERIKRYEFERYEQEVDGIDWVLVGHTPVQKAQKIGNVYHLDTGAAFYEDKDFGHLTLLEITNPELPLHVLDTAKHMRAMRTREQMENKRLFGEFI